MTWLQTPTRKLYGAGDHRVRPVELAVCHWTGSPPKGPGVADEARMRAWLADDSRQTSTHFVILRNGRVLQAAPFDARTWHAGGSTWVDPTGAPRKSVNGMSIGVDMENVGHLTRAPDGVGFLDGYGGRYKGAQPVKAAGGWWEPYTPEQSAAMVELAESLATSTTILRDGARWVGHCDIQPGKLDPGPLFPWAAIRGAVARVP